MKKIIFILATLVISLAPTRLAYAGSLNANEQQIISAARGRFEYQGNQYKLDEAYINQLIAYLSEEGRDLSNEDKDTVLQSMNNYIETGVKEGYLVPVNGQTDQKDTPSKDNKPTKDSNTSKNSNTADNSEDKTAVGKKKDVLNSNSDKSDETSSNAKISSSKNFLGGLLTEASSSENTESGQVSETNGADTLIIKNTGFDLMNTFMIAAGLGLVMLAGIIVTLKNNFFAQNDE